MCNEVHRDIKSNNKTPEEKEIILGFFDVLGTSKRIENDDYFRVYEFYQDMIDLCSRTNIALAFDNFPGMQFMARMHKQTQKYELVLLHPVYNAFFSDTFIVWVEYDNEYGMRAGGFYKYCIDIFVEALKRRIPLRGAISRGKAIMNNEERIYLGRPIVEAARLESSQNWLGISLGQHRTERCIAK